MEIGVIADDFTGASDAANALVKSGLRTTLCVGVPHAAVDPLADACVIALKSRSIQSAEAVALSTAAARWITAQGSRRVFFKYCSTFDSTSEGNIGPVAAALLSTLDTNLAIVCPAFPEAGRSVYQGHLFVGDRLLNESGLERHPINPMTDPDIRRWLRRQTTAEVAHLPLSLVRQGELAVRKALESLKSKAPTLVVVDADNESDLDAIGAAVCSDPLATGGSAVLVGIGRRFSRRTKADPNPQSVAAVEAPAVVLSGSCSNASRLQVARHGQRYPALAAPVDRILASADFIDEAVTWCMRHKQDIPMVYTSAEPGSVALSQSIYGRESLASAIDGFFGTLATELVRAGFRRIVVGGGETSGAVVSALGIESMSVGPEIDPGVPALFANQPIPLGLALKSGNFGVPEFYEKAAFALKGAPACMS